VSGSPFLTIAEAAELARVSPKRLRNLMADGTLRDGLHYSRPRGLRPRFKRDALVAWLEGKDGVAAPSTRSRARCKLNPALLSGTDAAGDGL
jgi:excisionase family DNA binding protein